MDDTFGGKLFSRYQGNTKEEKTPVLPLSGMMANTARRVTGVVAGVSRSPLAEEGRAREDAQWSGLFIATVSVLSSPIGVSNICSLLSDFAYFSSVSPNTLTIIACIALSKKTIIIMFTESSYKSL